MVDKSEKFTWLVRVGFTARGIVYILLGYLALTTAGEAREGSDAVFDYIQEVPLGTPLLWLAAIGLLAYALFRFVSAIADIQNHGSDAKGILKRVGELASGVAHLFLAYAAYQFASGAKRMAEAGGDQAAARSVLDVGMGWIVILLIGLGFLVGAVMQAKNAWSCHFMHRLSASAPDWTKTIGRIGHAARAIVFAIIGWSMVTTAWQSRGQEVKGLGEALLALRDMGIVYTLVAIGLILFGVFTLISARYRIIPDVNKHSMKPKVN